MAKAKKPMKKASKKNKSAKPAVKPALKAVAKTNGSSTKNAAKQKSGKKPVKQISTGTDRMALTKTKVSSPSKKTAAKSGKAEVTRGARAAAKEWTQILSPLDDRILILRETESNRTPGGLFIPDSVSDYQRPNKGKVVAVGRGHCDKKGRMRPLDVKLADHVLFDQHAGQEIELLGEKLLILRENDVLGVVS